MVIYLQVTNFGTGIGTADLYSDVDGFTTPVYSNYYLPTLVSGINLVFPDGTTVVRVKSTGPACENYLDITIGPVPTTTTTTTIAPTTTTTSTTLFPGYNLNVYVNTKSPGGGIVRVYYKYPSDLTWSTLVSSVTATTCTSQPLAGVISGIPAGSTILLGVTTTSVAMISFAGGTSSQCSASSFPYCGIITPYSQVINSNTAAYLTCDWVSSNFVLC